MAENRGGGPFWFLGGLLVGAAAGLLFAKKPGYETREDVKNWLNDKREKSQEYITKWKEEHKHNGHRRPARETSEA